MNRRKSIWSMILTATLAALFLGCGWDNTPKLIIPTPAPTETVETERPRPGGSASSETVESADPDATTDPDATPDNGETPDPNATVSPTPVSTADPNLIGLWEFTKSTYKGATTAAKDTDHSIVIRFYDDKNRSATVVIDKTETTGLQYNLHGATLTLTLYGETMFTFIYDGTYIVWEQEVDGDYDDLYFEKTGK